MHNWKIWLKGIQLNLSGYVFLNATFAGIQEVNRRVAFHLPKRHLRLYGQKCFFMCSMTQRAASFLRVWWALGLSIHLKMFLRVAALCWSNPSEVRLRVGHRILCKKYCTKTLLTFPIAFCHSFLSQYPVAWINKWRSIKTIGKGFRKMPCTAYPKKCSQPDYLCQQSK